MTDELHLAFWGAARLGLGFTAGEGCLRGDLSVHDGPLEIAFEFLCIGWDLQQFAEQLEALHESDGGEAFFANADGNIAVQFKIIDPQQGLVDVHTRLIHRALRDHGSRDTTYTFDGVTLEQANILRLVRQIREFLRVNRITVQAPPPPE